MSILSSMNSSGSMNGPSFHEFKKQASFFLKEKIRTARLALTDVTPAQLMAEEATNGNPGGPDSRTLKMLSRAAFEVDDYCRIVEILHKRLVRFDKRNWRPSYKALIVLEYLLTHGPERIAEEFQSDRDSIAEMESFQHIDDKGFNWGMIVRKKSERILQLLKKGPLLKEERDKARKISRGIEGFGSFCHRTNASSESSVLKSLARCNSEFNDHSTSEKDELSAPNKENIPIKTMRTTTIAKNPREMENLSPESKEIMGPDEEVEYNKERGQKYCMGESKPLLDEKKNGRWIGDDEDDHHPFDDADKLTNVSLLQAC